MATANPAYSAPKDLTRCGICNEIINEPKALPCLHTFCLECIREWSKPSRESVTCPIVACKKTTPMPSNGVDGLPGNVFVSSLIDRSPIRGKLVPCVCCKETDNKVLARCFDCNGFLCKKGVDLHQELLLRSHQVIMLEDIKSGKVDLKMLADKKPPTCREHIGQQLWLYCVTCGVLICRDCTVLDHQKPGHNYVALKNIATEQRSKIKGLIEESGEIGNKINKALKDTADAKKDLDRNKHHVIAEIDKEIARIKKHVDKVCRDERNRLLKQHEESVLRSEKSIAEVNEALQKEKIRSQTARDMANQALQNGSDSDIASVYKQLATSLQDLCKIDLVCAPHEVAELPKFSADSKITNFTSIGTIPTLLKAQCKISIGTISVPLVSSGTWEFEKKIDSEGVLGISSTPKGDIVVTEWSGKSDVIKVYSHRSGTLRLSLDSKSTGAWNVVASSAGQFYATCGGGGNPKDIRVFGSDGRYYFQFAAVSPSGVKSDEESTDLRGLAINHKDQLLVGEVQQKYISIHDLKGNHITSFIVSIAPYFIATTCHDNIIVSSSGRAGVQILDSTGKLQHTINAPEGVSHWVPKGVFCSMNDEICVGNRGTRPGVYCFSSTGVYLGCIIKINATYMWGVALFENDRKIAITDFDEGVQTFRRK